MKFLTARWENLLFANYSVAPSLLVPYLPRGTRIDEHQGKAYLSLVAFRFRNTRVLGVPDLLHRSFDEVNLRFYVTPVDERAKRAVVFVKELVPSRLIPWVANTLFCENYASAPMMHEIAEDRLSYAWGAGQQSKISATLNSPLELSAPSSPATFITEHYWGYAMGRRGTLEYQVEHPPWKSCELDRFEIQVDFDRWFGPTFGLLADQPPDHVFYAEGSRVAVSCPRRLAYSSAV